MSIAVLARGVRRWVQWCEYVHLSLPQNTRRNSGGILDYLRSIQTKVFAKSWTNYLYT
jgi:hypothetical protein